MRTLPRTLCLGGLAFILGGWAVPYYAAAPAPVYYPLERSWIYYPAQRASIADPGPRAIDSAEREQLRNSKHRPTRTRAGEDLTVRRSHEGRGTSNDSGWINPEP